MEKKPLLVAENIDKKFDITHAVDNVSLTIYAGEIRGLIGENGSGKSTFSQMLCGIYTIGGGTFKLDGKELHVRNQVEANNEGVAIIVQEMGTLSGLTVAENIFLGHEDPFMNGVVKNTAAMNKEAQRLLNEYGFGRIDAANMIDAYNFEDRKLIEIVKATYMKPKILVVDETTTALSQNGRMELYKIMDQVRDDGRSVIFISHDLGEVLEHTDTVTVLRDGEYIDTVNTKDVTEDDLKRLMVGREIGNAYYRTDYGTPVSKEVVLSIKNVTVPKQIYDISLTCTRVKSSALADFPNAVCTRSGRPFSGLPGIGKEVSPSLTAQKSTAFRQQSNIPSLTPPKTATMNPSSSMNPFAIMLFCLRLMIWPIAKY